MVAKGVTMKRFGMVVLGVMAGVAFQVPASRASAQFPPDSFTNLKVLPRDIRPDSLVRMMMGFTRALGVRCTHCHVGEESRPLETYDFASDEKLLKRKARPMIEMLVRINAEHLPRVEQPVEPALRVECATCHRGVRVPRPLQQILLAADQAAGMDSLLSAYRNLRARYYGGAAYDFGEVALADVGTVIASRGRGADAERIHALNVEMNPASTFARRMHAATALMEAFQRSPVDGRSRYTALKRDYGVSVVSEPLVNQAGYTLLRNRALSAALEVFKLNAEEYPESANAHDSLGEGYVANGDTTAAIRAYERSLTLNPNNANATEKLKSLKRLL
jgi:hypothetical protein